MTSSTDPTTFWHRRFLQQAEWTQSLRNMLWDKINLQEMRMILEVGSGTGVILKEISALSPASTLGLDLDLERLKFGSVYAPDCLAVNGDGLRLPLTSSSVDLSLGHFLLLWVADPLAVLKEMTRVTRPQGWVMALAEPDYGGRIDHPPRLIDLGKMQIEALEKQGADTRVGRRLLSLFLETGLTEVETGILGGEWHAQPEATRAAQQEEWDVLISDLGDAVDVDQRSSLKQDWFKDGRILYVPTFYAIGRVPV